MAIRTKLTVRDGQAAHPQAAKGQAGGQQTRKPPSEEEKATRKTRVEAAKDALKRSVGLRGDHVAPARSAIQLYLRRLNESPQPDDAAFADLIEGPFRVPPKKKERR